MPLSGKPDGAEAVFRQIAPMRSEMRAAILIPHMMKKATRTESNTNEIGAGAQRATHVEAKPGRSPPTRRMTSEIHRTGLRNSSARCAPLTSGNASNFSDTAMGVEY